MWSRQLFIVWVFAVTILATQSHVIHKRGLISRLFGRGSRSNDNVEGKLPSKERSKFRELLKNPIVITLLSAAVGMVVQKALSANSLADVCDNKYVKMAHQVSNFNWELQQVINLLGCNTRYMTGKSTTLSPGDGLSTKYPGKGFPTITTTTMPASEFDDNEANEETNDQNEESLESSLPPEKISKIKQLLSIARGEKGSKRNFLKNLFGLNKKAKTFKQGHQLPSSSYKLDKDDAKSLQELEKELEQYNKSIH